jgi:hypothetical protein
MANKHMHKEPLSAELTFYEEHKAGWLTTHAGEFVLISGKHESGFFPSYEAAFEAGLQAFGLGKEFLIKQVCEHEPVFVIY